MFSLDQIEQKADQLELRPAKIIEFLQLLSEKGAIENKELLRLLGLPENHFKRLLEEFSEILKTSSNQVVLKQKIAFFQPKREYDQFPATTQTVRQRTQYLAERGDLLRRKIVFLGDKDLVSLAVIQEKEAKKVLVIDIDSRVLALIKQSRLPIETLHHDLRQPFPPFLFQQFDVVFTDPPFTPQGVSLFLNRAVELLKPQLTSRIYLCYGTSDRARERELKIQTLINEKGLIINTKISQFNQYLGAEKIGNRSDLYLLDWTPQTKVKKPKGKRLYTWE